MTFKSKRQDFVCPHVRDKVYIFVSVNNNNTAKQQWLYVHNIHSFIRFHQAISSIIGTIAPHIIIEKHKCCGICLPHRRSNHMASLFCWACRLVARSCCWPHWRCTGTRDSPERARRLCGDPNGTQQQTLAGAPLWAWLDTLPRRRMTQG